MRTLADDTSAAAERAQIELMRSRTPAWRVARALALTQDIVELARRGIRRRQPELTEEEVLARFVELHYGAELAEGFRGSLRRGTEA